MANNADEKRVRILETAKRRFAHYGMAKTTMAEIAKDLSFSKALLYYYFPDKNSLYAAVLEHVIEECQGLIENSISNMINVLDGVNSVLDISMNFKKKYFYLLEYTIIMRKELPTELDKLIIDSFESQRKTVEQVFQKGVDSGELKPIDVEDTARIFVFGTLGMRMSVLKDFKNDFIPDKCEFDEILAMQKKLAEIFVAGLRA
ncbi:TetR/AcrR family transcriptional regulator [Sphingobacterium litopenaei]|jgi:TetR/AcrR family transcriptional regulator|uniref:TetR/AcrR family transcriptional regulator n=1 Tax=Sphingobacterium litopenaei TaxID=2763500 RepID=A0ABR7YE56_9SPHI|nr:TetR/AcrR family transcriptional regulator [Sphingobacterium litopenaei]MBD1429594.1 TetR/AcrR family transcriptional regulator [Sphingobacterium litopenaei]